MTRKKNQGKKIMVGMLMGMNCVNGFLTTNQLTVMNNQATSPMAGNASRVVKGESDSYTAACYQALNVVDKAIFGTAEAADVIVASGQIVSGEGYAYSNVHQTVQKGGQSVSCTFTSAATQRLYGESKDDRIGIKSMQTIYDGGVAYNTSLSGGYQTGGSYAFTGIQDISKGGSAVGTKIDRYGLQKVSAGGVAKDAVFTASERGAQIIFAGALAENTTFNSHATQTVYGEARGNIMNGGIQNIDGGGLAADNQINAGAQQNVMAGGSSENNIVNAGGVQNINSGGVAYNNEINSGGLQNINSGGQAINNTIKEGGSQHVFNGGTAENNTVEKGALQTVDAGGVIVGGKVAAGGSVAVGDGGNALGTNLEDGATQTVGTNGKATATNIAAGSVQDIEAGGVSEATNIAAGGEEKVAGASNEANIHADGKQTVVAGGVATGANIAGGTQTIENGGNSVDGIITKGSQVVEAGGEASGTTVTGGQQDVKAGGVAIGTDIEKGGSTVVVAGGEARDTMVKGGNLTFEAGASITGNTILSGGTITLGATTSPTPIITPRLRMASPLVAVGTVINQAATPATYNIDSLEVIDGGIINVGTGTNPENYSAPGRTLNIGTLNGSAEFVINADLANSKADFINVTNAIDSNNNVLQVNFTPQENLGQDLDANIKVFKAPTTLGLTGKEGEVGAYHYTPDLEYVNGYWVLKGLSIARSSEAGEKLATLGGLTLGSWREGDLNIENRLNNIRHSDHAYGLWANVARNDINLNGVSQEGTTYTVGYDHKGNANWSYGVALSYGKGDNGFTNGNGSFKDHVLSGYAAWHGQGGHFADIIFRGGRLQHNFDLGNSYNTYRAVDDITQNAMSLSAKYGYSHQFKNGAFIEPYAKVGYGHVVGASFTTSDGISVTQDNSHSIYGRLGLTLGKQFTKAGTLYADVAVSHEFAGNVDTALASNHLNPLTVRSEVKGTWMDINVGYQHKMNKNMSWYCNVGRLGMGGDLAAHWNYTAGLTYRF